MEEKESPVNNGNSKPVLQVVVEYEFILFLWAQKLQA